MTHEYKHKVDLNGYNDQHMMAGIVGLPDLLAYAHELEARIEKMQAAGDILVQIAGIIGLCWASPSFPTMGHVQEAVDNWRNA